MPRKNAASKPKTVTKRVTKSKSPAPVTGSDPDPNAVPESKECTGCTSRRYIFTINNWTKHPTFDQGKLTYLLFGEEIAPTTGTPHLQGYLECKALCRFTALHKIPGFESASFRIAIADHAANYRYCTKDGTYFEYGTAGPGAGARTDIYTARDIMKEHPNEHGLRLVLEKYPMIFFQFHKALKEVASLYRKPPTVKDFAGLRAWQATLSDKLLRDPDPRKIHFYVDTQGAAGKSYFVRYWVSLHFQNTLSLTNAKHTYLINHYEGQKYIFFDLTRCSDGEQPHPPYSYMEHFKNGYKPPGMYGSPACYFDPPHVVVFMNYPPDLSALSSDRFDIYNLS